MTGTPHEEIGLTDVVGIKHTEDGPEPLPIAGTITIRSTPKQDDVDE